MNPTQTTISLWQKIVLILFGLLLTLVILEIGLRLEGFIILSLQEHRNLQSIKQKGTYRILCLGESTTQRQHPYFLEKVLNQRNLGIKFSVIDKGLSGVNTGFILSQIETNLDNYKPDMVVAMMGINDGGSHIPYEAITTSKSLLFFRSLRTYKLLRLLWLHIVTKAREIGSSKLEKNKQPVSKPWLDLLQIGLKEIYTEQESFVQQEESAKKSLELNPRNDKAYAGLGWVYNDQGKLTEAEQAFKKSLQFNPRNDKAYVGLGRVYKVQGRLTEAEQAFKKSLELNPRNDKGYGGLETVYFKRDDNKLFKEYKEKMKRPYRGYYNVMIVNNYLKLAQILDKRNVRLACVQYPLLSIGPLRKIFEGQRGVIFVDNEKIFRDAVRKGGYRAYFVDVFAAEFGHCTEKGNLLLAENIANAILKEVFGK